MKGRLGDKQRLPHIFDAITEIETYVENTDFNSFQTNSMMRFATVKQLEIIGEASNHLSDDLKQKFTGIDWPKIIGMRNILVHEYFGIDDELIWQIVTGYLPELKKEITTIIKQVEN